MITILLIFDSSRLKIFTYTIPTAYSNKIMINNTMHNYLGTGLGFTSHLGYTYNWYNKLF